MITNNEIPYIMAYVSLNRAVNKVFSKVPNFQDALWEEVATHQKDRTLLKYMMVLSFKDGRTDYLWELYQDVVEEKATVEKFVREVNHYLLKMEKSNDKKRR